MNSKLALTIYCDTYETARALVVELTSRGFRAGAGSPSPMVWTVTVSVTPSTVNQGETMFEELQLAWAFAQVFLQGLN